ARQGAAQPRRAARGRRADGLLPARLRPPRAPRAPHATGLGLVLAPAHHLPLPQTRRAASISAARDAGALEARRLPLRVAVVLDDDPPLPAPPGVSLVPHARLPRPGALLRRRDGGARPLSRRGLREERAAPRRLRADEPALPPLRRA